MTTAEPRSVKIVRHDASVPKAMKQSDEADVVELKGAAKTRQAISDAARELFAHEEYANASVRNIASKAGADPALVIRYFGSKEQLFLETVQFEGFFELAMAGPLEGLGERIVSALLSDQRDAGFSAYRAMMRASGSEVIRRRLLEAIHEMFVEPLAPRLKGPDAALRARLVAAQLAGLIDGIAILEDAELAATDRKRLSEVYGAALQGLIQP
ncbi:MAG: TetR/AcrR family transcriptional regulator [Marmoricola sp.]|nr:TetR/AcrR family transcriptional regulator [Marmoricola sp.]